ncbi:MAG: Uncharacterised protein [Cryomorphaceae bacterium]|nr:MAG: Uncharacterised protein [Cryomorphaceae bacterium]
MVAAHQKKVLEDLAWRMNDDGEADRIGHAKYQEC